MNLLDLETNLWQKWMKNPYYRRIHNHINQLFYYNDFIQLRYDRLKSCGDNDRLDAKTTATKESIDIIPRSFWNVILPGMVNMMFVIGALPFVLRLEFLEQYKFFQVLPQFIPKNGPRYVLTLNVIWSTMHFFQMFYGHSTQIERYGFLHVLNLNDKDNGGLRTCELYQFKLFRNRLLSLERCLIISIATICPLLMLSMIIQHSAWTVSVYLTIFWAIVFDFCVWHICSSTYQFPTFIVIVQYYLILKQKSIQEKMYRFRGLLCNNENINKGKRWMRSQLNTLNQNYKNLQKEIVSNDQQLKRYLNILFIGFNLLITYLTCLIFLVDLTIDFLFIYSLVYVAHIGLLSVLIYNCSRIEQLNREFLKTNQKCLHLLNEKKVLSCTTFYKLDSLTRIMLEKVTGFILFNGTVITSRTFITLFANISTFFFLISQQIA
ncbi:uncharacterized protein LOC124492578 [Dermatophagoides farinae]|uniref:uncharacterized protein LOC124492578 n=1 Tax=Dermatophagoides farinae TaxID=6954 RepID=UPI003F5F963F